MKTGGGRGEKQFKSEVGDSFLRRVDGGLNTLIKRFQ